MKEVKKEDEVNTVNRGQGQEFMNDSEILADPNPAKGKTYALWVELKAGIVSESVEGRMVKDIVGEEEDDMSSSEHH